MRSKTRHFFLDIDRAVGTILPVSLKKGFPRGAGGCKKRARKIAPYHRHGKVTPMTYAAHSEPRENEAAAQRHYCANCGAVFVAAPATLPDLCPACADMTTWRTSPPPARIPWRETTGPIEPHEPAVAGVRVYDVGWLASIDKPEDD